MLSKMGFSFYKRVSFVKETTLVENSKELHCKRKSKFALPRMTKMGEVGETVTWMVATIAIVVILFIAVFVSSVYFNNQKKASPLENSDYLAASSFNSWLLTENSTGTMVYEQVKSEEDLNDFNGNLALSIFENFYRGEYFDVGIGIVVDRTLLPYETNTYFGTRPTSARGGDINRRTVSNIVEGFILSNEKTLELVLAPKK